MPALDAGRIHLYAATAATGFAIRRIAMELQGPALTRAGPPATLRSMAFGYSGSAPSPFDAINGGRLGGGSGSHPLHDVRIEELLRATDGSLGGGITLAGPAMVGEPIRGRIDLIANHEIKADAANLRLVGLRLVEEKRSRSESHGSSTTVETWVECHGRLFSVSPFLEPVIPTRLAPGETFSATFAIPAPALGPPTAHLGEAIVAWALEVRWNVPMGFDPFLATLLPIAQHPSLLAAGVGDQGGQSMLQTMDVDGATISVASALPARPGQPLEVVVTWPGAPSGPVRVELHRRTNAPNGAEGVVATWNLSGEELAAGNARASLRLPADLAPSFDGADLRLDYVIRVLVDRRFMPDTAIERPVAIT